MHCRVQNIPPLDHMLNVINHIHILITYCIDIDFNIIFPYKPTPS